MDEENPGFEPALPDASNVSGDERTTLVEMLDYYRAVLLRKAHGLTDEQRDAKLPFTDLTIGGLIYHMALVEDFWFHHRFAGNDKAEPWASMPWDDDSDYDFHNASALSQNQLVAQFNESVDRSRAVYGEATSLDQLSVLERDGKHWNMRWIMVHMIEEYARHCGHADLLRQSIDGNTGD